MAKLSEFLCSVSSDLHAHRQIEGLAEELISKHGTDLSDDQKNLLRRGNPEEIVGALAIEEGGESDIPIYVGWAFYGLPMPAKYAQAEQV